MLEKIKSRAKDLCSDIFSVLKLYDYGATTEFTESDAVDHAVELIKDIETEYIDKACKCYCDLMCEKGMCGMCYFKHDSKGQTKNSFKYDECNELKLIRHEMVQ